MATEVINTCLYGITVKTIVLSEKNLLIPSRADLWRIDVAVASP